MHVNVMNCIPSTTNFPLTVVVSLVRKGLCLYRFLGEVRFKGRNCNQLIYNSSIDDMHACNNIPVNIYTYFDFNYERSNQNVSFTPKVTQHPDTLYK